MQYHDEHIVEQCWNQVNEALKEETRYFYNGQDKAESEKPALGMAAAATDNKNPTGPVI